MENLTKDSICVIQTSVIQTSTCIAVGLHLPKAFHRQYMCISKSHVFDGLVLSVVRSSTPGHVSTKGCPEGWQCNLRISNIVPGISPGIEFDASLFGAFEYACIPLVKDVLPCGRVCAVRTTQNGAHEFAEFDVQFAKILFVISRWPPAKHETGGSHCVQKKYIYVVKWTHSCHPVTAGTHPAPTRLRKLRQTRYSVGPCC